VRVIRELLHIHLLLNFIQALVVQEYHRCVRRCEILVSVRESSTHYILACLTGYFTSTNVLKSTRVHKDRICPNWCVFERESLKWLQTACDSLRVPNCAINCACVRVLSKGDWMLDCQLWLRRLTVIQTTVLGSRCRP